MPPTRRRKKKRGQQPKAQGCDGGAQTTPLSTVCSRPSASPPSLVAVSPLAAGAAFPTLFSPARPPVFPKGYCEPAPWRCLPRWQPKSGSASVTPATGPAASKYGTDVACQTNESGLAASASVTLATDPAATASQTTASGPAASRPAAVKRATARTRSDDRCNGLWVRARRTLAARGWAPMSEQWRRAALPPAAPPPAALPPAAAVPPAALH